MRGNLFTSTKYNWLLQVRPVIARNYLAATFKSTLLF